jgi:hypothetical protein
MLAVLGLCFLLAYQWVESVPSVPWLGPLVAYLALGGFTILISFQISVSLRDEHSFDLAWYVMMVVLSPIGWVVWFRRTLTGVPKNQLAH